ncbi:MAG: sugar ABC transporter permease [Clostridia bacterium]|nr:sugar ABC transporter permease [Clostridia bacterium]
MSDKLHAPKRAIRPLQFNKWYEPYLLLTPMLLMLGFLFLYPIVLSWCMAFQKYKLTEMYDVYFYKPDQLFTNFINLFKRDRYITRVTLTSLYMTPLLVVVSTVFGLTAALALNKKIPLRGFFQTIIFLPSAISGFLTSIMFRWMANAEYGVFNDLLMRVFHITSEKISFLSSPVPAIMTVVLATVWVATPGYAMTLLAAMQSIPKDIEEAAEIDGCNAVKRVWYITLPYIKPTFVIMFLLKFIWSFNYMDIVSTVTGGGPAFRTTTLPMYMYSLGFSTYDFGRAAALGLCVLAGLGLFVIVYMKLTKYEKAGEDF